MEDRLQEDDIIPVQKDDSIFGDSSLGVAFVRSDLIRIMMKSLLGMGFRAIYEGKWEDCLQLCSQIDFMDTSKKKDVHTMILERTLVEFIGNNKIDSALHCLRFDLKPLIKDVNRLNELSHLLVCPTPYHVSHMLSKLNIPQSRTLLQERIKGFISPSQVIQENRLETLLLQALRSQTQTPHLAALPTPLPIPLSLGPMSTSQGPGIPSMDLFTRAGSSSNMNTAPIPLHTSTLPPLPRSHSVGRGGNRGVCTLSLLYDASATSVEDRLPGAGCFTLEGHQDEVWVVCFSPDGRLLASASRDGTLRVWDVYASGSGSSGSKPRLLYILHGHSSEAPSRHMRWSSDSSQLLSVSCCNPGEKASVLRWEIPTKDTENGLSSAQQYYHSRDGIGNSHHGFTSEFETKSAMDDSGSYKRDGAIPFPSSSEHSNGTVVELSCRQRYEMHSGEISSAEWVPMCTRTSPPSDLHCFVSGGVDRQLLLCDQWGVCLARLGGGGRVGSLAVLFPSPPPPPFQGHPDGGDGGRWIVNDESIDSATNRTSVRGMGMGMGNGNGNGFQNILRRDANVNGVSGCGDFEGRQWNDCPESNVARRLYARQLLIGCKVVYVSAEKDIRLVVVKAKDSVSLAFNETKRLNDREPSFVFIELARLAVDKPISSLSLPTGYLFDGLDDHSFKCRVWGAVPQCSHSLSNSSSTTVLVAVEGGELNLVDIQVNDDVSLSLSLGRKVRGARQERLCLTPSLVGDSRGGLVASGSEGSGAILIWNAFDGALLTTLTGHTGMVNCVSWCPERATGNRILASAADDHTVRIWTTGLVEM